MYINPTENIGLAMRQVWTHRFRSLLTILGIVIGITTVVTVASLLTGLRQGIVTFFQELGPDNVFVARFLAMLHQSVANHIRHCQRTVVISLLPGHLVQVSK